MFGILILYIDVAILHSEYVDLKYITRTIKIRTKTSRKMVMIRIKKTIKMEKEIKTKSKILNKMTKKIKNSSQNLNKEKCLLNRLSSY